MDDTVLKLSPSPPASKQVVALAPGDVVGRYVIVELRGAGGMGAVYRARDRALGRDVALKVVKHRGDVDCGTMCSLLLREAQTMARVAHPSLASVHDVGEHQGCVYVAMEFIDGETLRDWAQSRPWQARSRALHEAGLAVAAAHRAQIVHRDLKPENVIVAASGRVVVMDFGIARSMADLSAPEVACECATEPAPALEGSVGTPQYMAPEQIQGKAADFRADQFGFSVMAWEILYGRPPFLGDTAPAVFAAVLAQELTDPPEGSEVPQAVASVLRRALRLEASARYVSMEELVDRFARAASLTGE